MCNLYMGIFSKILDNQQKMAEAVTQMEKYTLQPHIAVTLGEFPNMLTSIKQI